jgi:hypothetical protein
VTSSVATRGSGSPELGVLAAPGVKSTRPWVGRDLRDTCDLPRAKERHGEGSSDDHDGGGGSARRRNDGARVPASGAVYSLRQPAQKEQGVEEELTKRLWRQGLRRMGEVDDDRQRRGSALAGKGDAEGLRAPDHRRSTREGPMKMPEGLGKSGNRRR